MKYLTSFNNIQRINPISFVSKRSFSTIYSSVGEKPFFANNTSISLLFNNNLRTVTHINKKGLRFTIIRRGMLTTTGKTMTKQMPQTIKKSTAEYSAFACKKKYQKDIEDEISKYHYDIHHQCFTDFDFIYENPEQSRIYEIGVFVTNYIDENTTVISRSNNFEGDNHPQNLKFFNMPKEVISPFLINKKSYHYFRDLTIKKRIEDSSKYVELKNKVKAELEKNNVKFREATEKEMFDNKTGFYTFLKSKYNILDLEKELENDVYLKLYKIKLPSYDKK